MAKNREKEVLSTGQKVANTGKNTVFWVLSVFLLLSGLVFMPSVSSILFFVSGVLLLPVNAIREMMQKLLPKKVLRGTVCTVLAMAAFSLAPTSEPAGNVGVVVTPTAEPITMISSTTMVTPMETETPVATLIPTDIPTRTNTSVPTATLVPTDVPAPTNTPTPTATNIPTPTATPTIVVAATVTPLPTTPPRVQEPEESFFEVHFIDVGQADAILVLCDDQAMMIDGGNSDDSSLIYTYLKKHGINDIDYMIATHPHEDHVGGLSGALTYAKVGEVYCSVTEYETKTFKNFVRALERQEKQIVIPKVGDAFTLGSALVEVIGVLSEAEDLNNSSIVLLVTYGETRFLFTGDADREAEQAILDSGRDISCDVLKVGHHGSEYATTYPFLRAAMPEYGVISVGEENSYGHPTEATLSRLRDAEVKVYRTDMQGDIICTSDGRKVSFTARKNEDADTLHATPYYEEATEEMSPSEEPVETPPAGTDYIGNRSTKKFHYTWCSSVKQMKESNKYYYTGTRDEMLGKGYVPCKKCNP